MTKPASGGGGGAGAHAPGLVGVDEDKGLIYLMASGDTPIERRGPDGDIVLIEEGQPVRIIAGIVRRPPLYVYGARGVHSFEARGSVPHSLAQLLKPKNIAEVLRSQRLPSWEQIRGFDWRAVPRRLLVFNVIVTGIYAIGVPAAFLASVLDPAASRTASNLSGVINGIGTISFTLFVDPTSSMITDQAIHGKRTIEEVRSMVFYLSLTAIAGTLLSQVIFYPAAVVIEYVAKFALHVHF